MNGTGETRENITINSHGYRECPSLAKLFDWTASGSHNGWQGAIGWDSKLGFPVSIFTTKLSSVFIEEMKCCTKKMVRPVDGYGNHRPEMWLKVEGEPVGV